MRSRPEDFELTRPQSLDHALQLLAQPVAKSGADRWRVFAGGTDVMVSYEAGELKDRYWLDLSRIDALRGINIAAQTLSLGALTSYSEIRCDQHIAQKFPLLAEAARHTGSIAIQNRGTLGGNIANASPAADTPPVLLAYGAKINLTSHQGRRSLAYEDFHTGYKTTERRIDEIIHSVDLALDQQWTHHYFRKVGTRKAQAISKVVLAGVAEVRGGRLLDLRLGAGSVADRPKRLKHCEGALRGVDLAQPLVGRLRQALPFDVAPIDDIRSTAEYRFGVTLQLLQEFLQQIGAKN